MKANRLNLCGVVRHSLRAAGYSTVAVVNAVNAQLGKLAVEANPAKTGGSSANVKKQTFRVSVSQSAKATGKLNTPLLFDAWHTQIEKAEALARFDSVALPAQFTEWMNGFAKADAKALEAEAAEVVAIPAE